MYNMYTINIESYGAPMQDRKHDCLNDIRNRILALDLPPGSDLDETSLCKAYGLSRTPLREILQKLSGDGFVRIAQNKGAKVASMDLAVMRSFFQTAPMVYANIARLAAENRTTVQLDHLKSIQHRFTQATQAQDAAQAAIENHAFHAQIGAMAHNSYLVAALHRLLIDHTRLSQTFYRPTNTSEAALVTQACTQHDAMIAAFDAQDTAHAIDLTLQHWDLSRDRMERFVRPDPLPVNVIAMQEDTKHAV